jgi:hypothetical protein
MQVDFDITAARPFIADLEDRLAEIRTGFVIPKTGVKNLHGLPVQGPQLIALQSLMLPDLLQDAFGRGGFASFL